MGIFPHPPGKPFPERKKIPSFLAVSGGLRIGFGADEAELLRRLGRELKTLLEAGVEADPVRRRLFPDAYDDPEGARAYRELVDDELREGKRAAVEAVAAALGESGPVEIELDGAEVELWLRVLTDLRLAIGTRLEVTEENMGAEVDPEGPDAAALTVLHWLGFVQESMLAAMIAE